MWKIYAAIFKGKCTCISKQVYISMPVSKTKMHGMEHCRIQMENLYTTKSTILSVNKIDTPVNICFLSSNNGKLNSYLLPCIPQMCIVNHKIWTFCPWQLPFWPEDPSCRSIEVSCTSHSATTKRLLSASLHLQGEPNRILTKIPRSPALPNISLKTLFIRNEYSRFILKKIQIKSLLYLEQSLQFNHQFPFLHSQIILCQ